MHQTNVHNTTVTYGADRGGDRATTPPFGLALLHQRRQQNHGVHIFHNIAALSRLVQMYVMLAVGALCSRPIARKRKEIEREKERGSGTKLTSFDDSTHTHMYHTRPHICRAGLLRLHAQPRDDTTGRQIICTKNYWHIFECVGFLECTQQSIFHCSRRGTHYHHSDRIGP